MKNINGMLVEYLKNASNRMLFVLLEETRDNPRVSANASSHFRKTLKLSYIGMYFLLISNQKEIKKEIKKRGFTPSFLFVESVTILINF